MIYLYAIHDPLCSSSSSSSSSSWRGARGLDDRTLAATRVGDVAAVCTEHGAKWAAPAASAEHLWRHEAVVETVMRQSPAVLPARFGTVLAGMRHLEEIIQQRGDDLAAGLARVRGCVELGLRVLWSPAPDSRDQSTTGADEATAEAGVTTGRAYMLARLGDERRRRDVRVRAEALAATLHDVLAPLARDSVVNVLPRPEVLTVSAYLVPVATVETFRGGVHQLASAHPELRVLCTGPWPAYHFAPALSRSEAVHA